MYATFRKETRQGRTFFRSGEKIHLFGCNKGWIPWLLGKTIQQGQSEPYAWHLRMQTALASARAEFPNAEVILVDIKPEARDEFLVCELQDVYGYSDSDWTPMLWRMRVLEAGEPRTNHLEDFDVPDGGDEIYEFLYAMGSVRNSKITGRWIAPKTSPTNGALLWPKPLAYFIDCITEKGRRYDTARA